MPNIVFCKVPFSEVFVLADGECICHCWKEREYDDLGDRIMKTGDLNKVNGLLSIWRDGEYAKLRKEFINQELRQGCRSCRINCNYNLSYNFFGEEHNFLKFISKDPLYPAHVCLEISTFCAYKCSPCHRQVDSHRCRGRGHMSMDVFNKIITGVKEGITKYITLYGQGESPSNPNFYKMVKILRRKLPSAYMHLCTNLYFVNTEEKIKQILTCGISHIQISFFATNKKEFNIYYRIDAFDYVLNNIKKLIEKRKMLIENGIQVPTLIWKYILFKWNDSDESLNWLYEISKESNIKILFTTTISPEDCESKKYRQGTKDLEDLIERFDTKHFGAYIQ